MRKHRLDWGLIKQAQQGNKAAFNALVIKYQNKLLNSISHYIHDPNEAKDIVQDSLIKAYKALPNFRGDSNFYTWLYQIAVNTAKNYLTEMHRKPFIQDVNIEVAEQIPSTVKNVDTPENYLIEDETSKLIVEELELLPLELKTAFKLREIDGLSYAKIAERMQCPIGTIRSRIFRARQIINEKLTKFQSQ